MTSIVILAGLAGAAALAVVAGPARRRPQGAGAWAMHAVGAIGLMAMGATALSAGALPAGVLAIGVGATLIVDPRAVVRLLAARTGRRGRVPSPPPFRTSP